MPSKEKEIKKLFEKVYSLADKIDELSKKISFYTDELKDLSDQIDLTLEDEEFAWKSIAPGVKQKVRKKKTKTKTKSEYGKWDGNL